MAPARSAAFKLGLGLSFGEDTDRGAAAAAGQRRQGSERRLGAAELIDQCAEGCRTDILAADQPEPAQALAVAQLDSARAWSLGPWIRSSSRQCAPPRLRSRRPILSAWRQ